jgi:glycosyltransferase involved in cell wall biosynthesis
VWDFALLEAMALSRAILSTPVGGNLEALGEDYPAYVRTPEEFAEMLERIIRDRSFAAGLRARNRQRFLERFLRRPMVLSYFSLVSEAFQVLRNAPA